MRRRLQELPHNLVWLLGAVAFWCLLWGGVDLKNILGGLLAAILVFVLFPMPPMGHELTLRPLRFAYFLAHFVFDLVRSAIEVGWWAIRPAPQPPSSVVAVKMSSRSDFFLTGTGILCTLIPGSVVVEAQRATGTIFLHVIGAGTPEEVELARQRSVEQEHRLLWAIGRRELLEEAGLL
ncbi:MAG TPA: Na+/H+ antiporter subunit E [Candidatus Brachybacterium merdavium]|uniref:Na+/H+ antiporter subunit E n=1 Tax=Candidatus Brachybacterium merdavium TaxID=2838513 RepID=A0A9D2LBP5_9MICO|nr:Na+/H+ antiporter subunit E [Candidatus Brachybacterium merdavium]